MNKSDTAAKLILLLIVSTSAVACLQPSDCLRGDYRQFASIKSAELSTWLVGDVLADAKVCTIGEFQVIGPADGSSAFLMVTKDSEPVFVQTDSILNQGPDQGLCGNGRCSISAHDRDGDGGIDQLSLTGSSVESIIVDGVWRLSEPSGMAVTIVERQQ